jgi:hypothetical protein
MPDASTNAELNRLAEAHEKGIAWRKWGPYLTEHQCMSRKTSTGRSRTRAVEGGQGCTFQQL